MNKLYDFLKEYYEKDSEGLKNDINEILKKDNFKDALVTQAEDKISGLEKSSKTLKDVFPAAFINSIKVYIYNNKDEIINFLKTSIKEEKLQNKIKDYINNSIIKNLNPMIAKFITADLIYSKIHDGISEYLNKPESAMEIVNLMCKGLDSASFKKISDIIIYIPKEGQNEIIDEAVNYILNNLAADDFLKNILN